MTFTIGYVGGLLTWLFVGVLKHFVVKLKAKAIDEIDERLEVDEDK